MCEIYNTKLIFFLDILKGFFFYDWYKTESAGRSQFGIIEKEFINIFKIKDEESLFRFDII